MPQVDNTLADDVILLAPSTFTMHEWASTAVFELAPVLHYDFPVVTPSEHVGALAKIIPLLLPTGSEAATQRRDFLETPSCDKSFVGVLEWLHRLEFASFYIKGQSRAWVLTDHGKASLRISNSLNVGNGDRVMKPRKGIQLEDQDVFEILLHLENDDWRCCILGKGVKPTKPYEIKGEKVFYIAANASGFNKWYMLALLLADKHGKPVKHTGSKGFYMSIINGTEHTKKMKANKLFDCDAEVHAGEKPPRQRLLMVTITHFVFRKEGNVECLLLNGCVIQMVWLTFLTRESIRITFSNKISLRLRTEKRHWAFRKAHTPMGRRMSVRMNLMPTPKSSQPHSRAEFLVV